MNIASLTVYGDDLVVQSIREVLPSEPEQDWRKGDAGTDGRTSLDSGFALGFASADTAAELVVKIRAYLGVCEARGISFAVPRIVAELRIGFAGADGLYFELADLALFAEMGLCLALNSASQNQGSAAPA